MKLSATLALLVLSSAFTACGEDDGGTRTDTSTPDAFVPDVPPDTADTTDVADTNTPDTAPDVADTNTPDTAPDVADTNTPDTAEVEVTPPCAERPVPFPMPTSPGAWNSLSAEAVIALGAANHRGQDVIVKVGNPQVLIGKFGYSFFDKDMKGEDVDVYMQREVPCGEWEQLGTFRTSDDGQYGTTYGIEDDGGRVFFEIPEDKRFPVGRYPVRMVLRGDLSVASFDLIVVEPGTQAIITDIDGTLTTGDDQLISEIALAIFNETYVQEAYPDGDKMVKAWFDKGYLIVYATGRPDMLRQMTERWVEPRYVPGPLHLADTNGQVVPSNDGVGTYKKEFIEYLENQGIEFVAAYGNATTDIYAYIQAGFPLDRIFIIGKHAGEEGTQALSGSYTSHLPWIAAFPEARVKAPPAFGWW